MYHSSHPREMTQKETLGQEDVYTLHRHIVPPAKIVKEELQRSEEHGESSTLSRDIYQAWNDFLFGDEGRERAPVCILLKTL